MSTAAIETVRMMMEALPENEQEQVAEHLRAYIADLEDDARWDATFRRTRSRLVEHAKQAKREIAAGLSQPFDEKRL